MRIKSIKPSKPRYSDRPCRLSHMTVEASREYTAVILTVTKWIWEGRT